MTHNAELNSDRRESVLNDLLCPASKPVRLSTGMAEWSTPPDFFDRLNKEFGFALDVCATAENAKCNSYFTMEQDGLSQEWTGICWMNPPYGKEIGRWMQKAYTSSLNGATVVCLVPARTDTKWWHAYAEHGEKRFVKGRLKFRNIQGTPIRNATASILDGRHAHNIGAPFPSVVIIFRGA